MKQTPVWSWRDAIRKADIAPLTKLVCYTLSNYLSDVGEGCFPSIKTLMEDTGLSNRVVSLHLRKASEAGLLEIQRKARNGRCNVYLPKFPEDATLAEQPALDLGETQVTQDHVTESHVTEGHVTSDDASPRQVTERHRNSPRNSPSNKKCANAVCADGVPEPEEPKPKKRSRYTESFERFWQAYPHKKGKAKAAEYWSKLDKDEREAAIAAIPAYVADCKKTDRPFRHGSTYISQKTWDDYDETPQSTTDQDEHLVRLVVNYGKDKSTWTPRLEEKLGPPPDHPECRIKRWIIDKAREVWRAERRQMDGDAAFA